MKQLESKILEVLEQTAKKAGEFLLANRTKIIILAHKDRQDILTNIDLGSEKIIIRNLTQAFPEWSILSEEKGVVDRKSDYQFIVDPLDGTKEYVRGIPLYNVSIALRYKDKLIAAAVYRPSEQQLFTGLIGVGAFSNGTEMHPSKIDSLAMSFVYIYFPSFSRHPETFSKQWQTIAMLNKAVYRMRSLSDENTACCWVALGGSEAHLNISDPPKYWDIAPGICIAEAAGCKVTDCLGKPIDQSDIESVVISNGLVHNEILEVIK